MRAALLPAIVAVALLIAGCGDDDGIQVPEGPSPSEGRGSGAKLAALVDHLPDPDRRGALAVDLASARRALGVTRIPRDTGKMFTLAASHEDRLGALALQVAPSPWRGPIAAVPGIDFSHVRAAAVNGSGKRAVYVLRTTQRLTDVAEALPAGWEWEGDGMLVNAERRREKGRGNIKGGSTVVASGGPGILVLGYDTDLVSTAAAAPRSSGEISQLVRSVDAPAIKVVRPGWPCVRYLAVADRIDRNEGAVVMVVPDADADRFDTRDPRDDSWFPRISFGDPVVDRNRIVVPFGYRWGDDDGGGGSTATPMDLEGHTIRASKLYECP